MQGIQTRNPGLYRRTFFLGIINSHFAETLSNKISQNKKAYKNNKSVAFQTHVGLP